jgi:hypothetical protein
MLTAERSAPEQSPRADRAAAAAERTDPGVSAPTASELAASPPAADGRRTQAADGPTLAALESPVAHSPLATPPPAEAPAAPAPSDSAQPAARAAANTTRAARHYRAHPSRPAAQRGRHDLDTLVQLHDAGDAARLVLQFGPHKGATLAQVAQRDPAYLRQLALEAQRPAVRVAATQLLLVLEAAEPKGRRRTPRT